MSAEESKAWLRGRRAGIVEATKEAHDALLEAGEDPRAADSMRLRLLGLVPMTEDAFEAEAEGRATAAHAWTIRDEYAARVMQTILANDLRPPSGSSAVQCYAIADEMLAARGGDSLPEVGDAVRSACLAAALAVFDAPGGFTRDQLAAAINGAKP